MYEPALPAVGKSLCRKHHTPPASTRPNGESVVDTVLNTSFIERLSLRIRKGSAYLRRRRICQARWKDRLEDYLELLRCHYNFIRPHSALKFGREIRTPAKQAGFASKRLSLREVFMATPERILFMLFSVDPAVDSSGIREQKRTA
jgi:hypothetical protein